MEEKLLEQAVDNGIWTLLFVVLFLYTLYDSRSREERYINVIKANQTIIEELSKKLNIVNDIQKNVCDIKDHIRLG